MADVHEFLRRLDDGFSGTLAVAACAEDTEERVGFNEHRVLSTASVIKTPIMVEVFRQAEHGMLALDETMVCRVADHVGGSGVLKNLSTDVQLSIRDYVTLMITVSDNTATNLLIDRVGGVDAVNVLMHGRLGLGSITLHRGISFTPHEDVPVIGTASALHLQQLYRLLAGGALLSGRACEAMCDILARQSYLDQAPRYVRFDQFARDELDTAQPVDFAIKGGAQPGVRNDTGIMRLRDRVVTFAIMTSGCADPDFHPDNEGMLVSAAAARCLVEHYWPGPGPAPVRPGPDLAFARPSPDPASGRPVP